MGGWDKSEAAVVNPQLGAQEHGLYSSSPPSGRPANGTQHVLGHGHKKSGKRARPLPLGFVPMNAGIKLFQFFYLHVSPSR